MDKKAGEKWLSIWWFFVLIVVGGGVVIGVLIFYGSNIESKGLEADILAERVLRCFADGASLSKNVLNENFDIFTECNLKKELFAVGSNYYLEIAVKDLDGNLKKEIKEGDSSLKRDCEVQQVTTAGYYPRCSMKNELFFYKDGMEKVRVEIISVSNQEIIKIASV